MIYHAHTVCVKRSHRDLIKYNRNQIVFAIFPIDLEPNGRSFGSKSIEKWLIQFNFGFDKIPERVLRVCIKLLLCAIYFICERLRM